MGWLHCFYLEVWEGEEKKWDEDDEGKENEKGEGGEMMMMMVNHKRGWCQNEFGDGR